VKKTGLGTIGARAVLRLALLAGAGVAWADMEVAPPAAGNAGPMREARRWAAGERNEEGAGGMRLIDRLLENAKLAEELGLSAETVAKLRAESRTIQQRRIDLDVQIRKLSLEQADAMSRLMMASDANTNEVMNLVDKIGQSRTEQAKLTVANMFLLRKYLTPEQIRRARELLHERMRKEGAGRTEHAEGRAAKKERAGTAAGAPVPKPPQGW